MAKPHKKFHPEKDIFAPLVGMNYRVGLSFKRSLPDNVPFAVRLEREPENQIRPECNQGHRHRGSAGHAHWLHFS